MLRIPEHVSLRRQVELIVIGSSIGKVSEYERVGVITLSEVAGTMFFALHQLTNHHDNPRDHFRTSYSEIEEVLERDFASVAPVGLVHSHPTEDPEDRFPSEGDCKNLPQNMFGIVVAPRFSSVCWYDSFGATHGPRAVIARSAR